MTDSTTRLMFFGSQALAEGFGLIGFEVWANADISQLDRELEQLVVKRLKEAAPQAEQAGVILGLETALDAAAEVALLDEIGSPAVRSYFNFANALQNGRDLNSELRTLGRDRICQIHCTDEDGFLLQDNKRLDMPAVKKTLDDMGWGGWLVIERSRDARDGRNVLKNFGSNTAYLKSIFQAG